MPGFPAFSCPPEFLKLVSFRQTSGPWPLESMMPSSCLILCCPLLLLPSIFPSIMVFFQWVGSLHQEAKVLEFHFPHLSFQWMNIQGWFPVGLTGLLSPPAALSWFYRFWKIGTFFSAFNFFKVRRIALHKCNTRLALFKWLGSSLLLNRGMGPFCGWNPARCSCSVTSLCLTSQTSVSGV